jgi:hypothetical protein
MFRDKTLYATEFSTSKTNGFSYSSRSQPELRVLLRLVYMNMWWLISLIAVEEKPLTISP